MAKTSERRRERDRRKRGRKLYLKLEVKRLPGKGRGALSDVQASLNRMRAARGLPALEEERSGIPDRPAVTRSELIDTLQECIRSGDYWLPSGWVVDLCWRNKESDEWRCGPFSEVMAESAENGRGFDKAVDNYLEMQRYKHRAGAA